VDLSPGTRLDVIMPAAHAQRDTLLHFGSGIVTMTGRLCLRQARIHLAAHAAAAMTFVKSGSRTATAGVPERLDRTSRRGAQREADAPAHGSGEFAS
jgi:hypothetical protein